MNARSHQNGENYVNCVTGEMNVSGGQRKAFHLLAMHAIPVAAQAENAVLAAMRQLQLQTAICCLRLVEDLRGLVDQAVTQQLLQTSQVPAVA